MAEHQADGTTTPPTAGEIRQFHTSDAMGVLMAWWDLLLNGWWRSEPGWIDRIGRVLGACWIVLLFVYFYALWL